jgi:hypothetical protein
MAQQKKGIWRMTAMSKKESGLDQMLAKPQEAPQKGISQNEVVTAFKLILGRAPENEKVLLSHQVGSLQELRILLLRSSEFASKYQTLQKSIAKD